MRCENFSGLTSIDYDVRYLPSEDVQSLWDSTSNGTLVEQAPSRTVNSHSDEEAFMMDWEDRFDANSFQSALLPLPNFDDWASLTTT